MKKFAVILLFFSGCGLQSAPSVVLHPPLYLRGDLVRIDNSESLGIVKSAKDTDGEWTYEIMFSDRDMDYKEINLSLEQRAVWQRTVWNKPEEIKAEIDNY